MPAKQWPNLVLCLKERTQNPCSRLLGKRKPLESTAGVLWEAQGKLCSVAASLCQRAVSKWKNVLADHVYHPGHRAFFLILLQTFLLG